MKISYAFKYQYRTGTGITYCRATVGAFLYFWLTYLKYRIQGKRPMLNYYIKKSFKGWPAEYYGRTVRVEVIGLA